MKNKIKIYASILGLVYVVMIGSILINEIGNIEDSFIKGYEEGRSGTPAQLFSVLVAPKEGKYIYNETLKSNGEPMSYEPERISFEIDTVTEKYSASQIISYIVLIVFGLLGIVLIPYIPILFFQIIRTVLVKELLDQSVVRRTIRLGWLLVIYFACETILELMNHSMVKGLVQLDDYNILFPQLDYTILLLGCLALFLGQVLSMSLKLKEEQDLTI